MKTRTQSQSQDRDREATTGRFPTLALFVVAELLCTGVLVASVILWI
jgi:putative copper export protein